MLELLGVAGGEGKEDDIAEGNDGVEGFLVLGLGQREGTWRVMSRSSWPAWGQWGLRVPAMTLGLTSMRWSLRKCSTSLWPIKELAS